MSTINTYKSREIKGELPESSAVEARPVSIETVSRDEVINRLREQKLKLNVVIEKGLTNAEVEKIRSELDGLIKELEAI